MFKHFLTLEWKAFFRSASLGTSIAIKIFIGFFIIYFSVAFMAMGVGAFFLIKKELHLEPLAFINKYMIYYVFMDLFARYMLQKMPVLNIKPLLYLPIKRDTIVHFSLGKTILSFFNWGHAFFFIPFTVVLMAQHYPIGQVLVWHFGILFLFYCNNFLNILINNKDSVFYPIAAVVVALAVAQYFKLFDITVFTFPFFQGLYSTYFLFLIPVVLAFALYYFALGYFKKNLNLDEGLASKADIAKTENLTWLNQFGTLGTFLKNDIKLLKRNKRSKMTLVASFFFVFYGLFFFTQDIYKDSLIVVFAGIFVTGGFLLNFGQFVPSWDSSYYQLMMSQNIKYRDYLSSKWWLMVIGTLISTVLASFYIYFGWNTYLVILAGAIYNIGVNSHVVLLAGAYVKTPIDLAQANKAFGDKQAFNGKTMLLSLPKILLPVAIYAIGFYFFSPKVGAALLAISGVLGFAFKNFMFKQIEKVYKKEKYATIAAYKKQ